MIWETYQQTKITGAENTAARAMAKADNYAQDISDARDQIERLSLACQAMWELVRERNGITEMELETKILEIDARDGQIDGKIGTQSLTCHHCGKPTHSKRDFCVMCGAPLRRQHKFES
ncbi:MAG: hypothetical protein R3242_05520 [Akkermansiaceae bacterium]|nr:hypothetical protein [Akkermansiaceae bacterium]